MANQVFQVMQANYARAGLSPHDAFNAAAKGMVISREAAQILKEPAPDAGS